MDDLLTWITWPYHLTVCYRTNDNGCIFFPDSSWSQGRNLLLMLMLKFEYDNNIKFRYWSFLDGDVELVNTDIDIWHEFLLTYQPAIGTPTYEKQDGVIKVVTTFDAILMHFIAAH
eukprot:UN05289